jgi:hypothetical protein
MCDTIAGQLIACFPKHDPAGAVLMKRIRAGEIEHVAHVESLDSRLAAMDLAVDPKFEFSLHLLAVPPGSEMWQITFLQFFYKRELLHALAKPAPEFVEALGRSDFHFTVVPNSLLTVTRPAAPRVTVADYAFSPRHQAYKTLLNLPVVPPSTMDELTIAILDTGLAPDAKLPVTRHKNFAERDHPDAADDDHGHGTVVALIVHDLAPLARLVIYKVADGSGRASEWDTLAALGARTEAHIINMSLQFGLTDAVCQTCGRASRSSRSAVFENVLGQLPSRARAPVLVAAAGNQGQPELPYPARFSEVLAIGSVTSRRALSSFSNYGEQDHAGDLHDRRYVGPGGESKPGTEESIGAFGACGASQYGTSFAAAYASGTVAHVWAMQGRATTAAAVVAHLAEHADAGFPGYDALKHGHGLIRVSAPGRRR